jgi:hypothetical protein
MYRQHCLTGITISTAHGIRWYHHMFDLLAMGCPYSLMPPRAILSVTFWEDSDCDPHGTIWINRLPEKLGTSMAAITTDYLGISPFSR